MHDFLRRERERVAAGEAEKGPRGPSVDDLLRLGASDLEQRCDQMAEADAPRSVKTDRSLLTAGDAVPKTGETKSPDGLRKSTVDDQKSKTGLRKLTSGDQKSRRGLRKPADGDSKSETGRRKLSTSNQKSETGPRKLDDGEPSSLNVAFTRHRQVRGRYDRVVQGVESRMARSRSRRSASSRLADSVTVWWRRSRSWARSPRRMVPDIAKSQQISTYGIPCSHDQSRGIERALRRPIAEH